MDTEEPNSDKGAEERPGDNVVPFPRDWLGSRDELVPFGRRAQDDESPGGGREQARDNAAEPAEWPSPAPSAADFWSEDSMALHDVVRAPETPPEDSSAGTQRDGSAAAGPREVQRRPGAIRGAGRAATGMRIAAAVSLAVLIAAAAVWRVVSTSSPPVAGGAGSGSGGSLFGAVGNALKGNLNPIGGSVLGSHPRNRQPGAQVSARRRPAAPGHRSARRPQVVAAISAGSPETTSRQTSFTGNAAVASPELNADYIRATPSASDESSAEASASVTSGAPASGTPSTSAAQEQAATASDSAGRHQASGTQDFGEWGVLGPGSSPNG